MRLIVYEPIILFDLCQFLEICRNIKMDRNIIKPFRTNAPFGLNSRRFSAIGFHPDLDSGGNMSKNKSALGPGQYNPENFECAYKKKCTGGSR